jgi:hypothetical protein
MLLFILENGHLFLQIPNPSLEHIQVIRLHDSLGLIELGVQRVKMLLQLFKLRVKSKALNIFGMVLLFETLNILVK